MGAALAVAALVMPACAPGEIQLGAAALADGLSEAALRAVAGRMDPAMRKLAVRHDPGLRQPDFWARPTGWESLDLAEVPDLGVANLAGQAALELNALRPFAKLPIRPMRPFVLPAAGEDRARALQCLTQAVYYEAAREPAVGQEAVAQVVLNRVRHPAYPKSICGVVYQGSARTSGCQFTFTCDGSLKWAPEPALWRRASRVAESALAGAVARRVGSATHYHAAYVAPYWAPTLVKMAQVGTHIFYRWTGPWGEPPAFTGRYAGREAVLSRAVLSGVDARTQGGALAPESQEVPPGRQITLDIGGDVRTYTVADPAAQDGQRTRVVGMLQVARRKPTREEVRMINDRLQTLDPPAGAAAATPLAAEPAPEPQSG